MSWHKSMITARTIWVKCLFDTPEYISSNAIMQVTISCQILPKENNISHICTSNMEFPRPNDMDGKTFHCTALAQQ